MQSPPAGVRLVPPLGKVHDRNVHVQLGVPLAGRVLQERCGHRAGRVPVLGALRPGPHVQSALHPSNGRPSGRQQRVRDRAGLVLQLPGALIRSALARLASGHQQRGVQDANRLGRAHREVKVRDRALGLGPLGRADAGQLARRGVWVGHQVSGHGRLLALPDRPEVRAGPRVKTLAVRRHPVHVERLELVPVHVPVQVEDRRQGTEPLARRLPGRLGVVPRPGRMPGARALGEVARVTALGKGRVSGHGR